MSMAILNSSMDIPLRPQTTPSFDLIAKPARQVVTKSPFICSRRARKLKNHILYMPRSRQSSSEEPSEMRVANVPSMAEPKPIENRCDHDELIITDQAISSDESWEAIGHGTHSEACCDRVKQGRYDHHAYRALRAQEQGYLQTVPLAVLLKQLERLCKLANNPALVRGRLKYLNETVDAMMRALQEVQVGLRIYYPRTANSKVRHHF